jgi:hypothetical protein
MEAGRAAAMSPRRVWGVKAMEVSVPVIRFVQDGRHGGPPP